MKKKEMLNEMVQLCEQINPILKRHSIKVLGNKDFEGYDYEELKRASKWLHTLHTKYIAAYLSIRNLLPESAWQAYDHFGGCDDLAECIALKVKIRSMKAFARIRPTLFK